MKKYNKKMKIKIIRSLLTPILGVSAIGAIAAASTSCGNDNDGNNIAVQSVDLDRNQLELFEGETEQLIATVLPEDASNKKVTWTSSNLDVAIVDENGVVTAVKKGIATITVITEDGGYIDTCLVIVSPVLVQSVDLDRNQLELFEGETEQLIATVLPEDASNKKVTWESSNPNNVTVDENGVVTAVKEGIANIIVTTEDGGYKARCTVSVKKPIPVQSVDLDRNQFELGTGQTEQLIATITPANATNKNLIWESSNPNNVTVDENGVVTAVGVGKVIITVTTEDGGYIDSCKVYAVIPVQSVDLDRNQLELFEGQREQLVATLTPKNASTREVTWKSSNEKVAIVDEEGAITAVGEGETTITVTTEDGGYKAFCMVNVKSPVYVKNVLLNKDELQLFEGKTEQLFAIVTPENATNKKVTWSSNNPNIATVDENGVVIAEGEGKTTITVTTEDGGYIDSCKVYVVIPVQSVDLDRNQLELFEGETEQLIATVLPEDATNKDVTWTSSNPNIATVDENGNIKALSNGRAIIEAKTEDGQRTARATVIVFTNN